MRGTNPAPNPSSTSREYIVMEIVVESPTPVSAGITHCKLRQSLSNAVTLMEAGAAGRAEGIRVMGSLTYPSPIELMATTLKL